MTKNQKHRLHCKACNVALVRFGKTQAGTKRFLCPLCRHTTISYQKKTPSRQPHFNLFEAYVLDGVTYQYLERQTGIDRQVLARSFHRFLTKTPPTMPLPEISADYVFLLVDGQWHGTKDVTLFYRRSDTKTLLHVSIMKKEYASLIKKDLQSLVDRGLVVSGVVSDGGTGIVKAIANVFPHTPHQHCLAHKQRQYLNALGQKPQDPRVQDLRRLACRLFLIESKAALKDFLLDVKAWYQRHYEFVWERRRDTTGRVWFAHPKARKVVFGLFKTAKTSFHFLHLPLMPKTSNCLEASLGVIKDKRRIHRGLREFRQPQFTRWFVYFYNQRLLTRNKQH